MESSQTRTWREISLGALEHNYHFLRSLLPQGCRFLGVVKANAYGNGSVTVARRLEALGCEYLAVACTDEAKELRLSGISIPILVLGDTPPACSSDLLEFSLTQTVPDLAAGLSLSRAAMEAGRTLKIHIKADTGMSRLGFLCDEAHLSRSADEICKVCALPGLEAEGIFTHFSDSDGNPSYTQLQFSRFTALLDLLARRGVTFPIRHCANSGAVLLYPETHLDMVRPGLALYGYYPAPSCALPGRPLLQSVMELKTRVATVRSLPKGALISYGGTYTLSRDSKLAVVPIGYADGLPRLCSNGLEMLIRGKRAPILGRVCMDMCMLDVTDLEGIQPGDIATVYGRDGSDAVPVEDAARRAGTVQYELLCAISERVPRIYL